MIIIMSKKVSVFVRIKPEISGHLKITNQQDVVWRTEGGKVYRIDAQKETCFDGYTGVFHLEDNLTIYLSCIQNVVEKFLENQNSTVFAYGQTGSGKTYTILGENGNGIINLCLENILETREVSVSYMEIYNEKIFDLFTSTELQIYTIDNTPVVSNLSSTPISSRESLNFFLSRCETNRKYGSTEFNTRSSRSHTIFQVKSEGSTLNLIDLAGSEKASINECRRKEGSYINKSLLALCNLVSNIQKNRYFGYRDSKLTRLLQPSLDGKTNIVALCMISPQSNCLEESIATLKFAGRLSNLEIKVTEKKTPEKKLVEKLEDDTLERTPENITIHETNMKRGYYMEQYMKHYLIKHESDGGMLTTGNYKKINESKVDIKMRENEEVVLKDSRDVESDTPIINLKDADKINFYENNKDESISKFQKEKLLLIERIASLEKMVIDMLKRAPSKRMKEIFILEKHMFNLKLKKFEEEF
ncbi:Kinesin-like protein tea2 [Nosema granulosis]|uniref:Kinesin-like protein n=1 Tax=Nosema granulosis TaxID=83296 RepID=A0A9P6KXQ7_9MICR|nr:Kinesin-like protein tea2 [Nosema granulosis]